MDGWVLSSRTRSQLSRHSRRTSLAFDGMLWPRRSRCRGEEEGVSSRGQEPPPLTPAKGQMEGHSGQASLPAGGLSHHYEALAPHSASLAVERGRAKDRGVGEAREDLQWWAEALASPLAMSLAVRPVTASITTDASEASVGFSVVAGSQRVEDTQPARDHRQSINSKELEAVLKGLEGGGELLRGRRVVLYTDNMTARAAVAR